MLFRDARGVSFIFSISPLKTSRVTDNKESKEVAIWRRGRAVTTRFLFHLRQQSTQRPTSGPWLS